MNLGMIKILDSNFDRNIYNQKASHPLQSWQWGEAKKILSNEVVRIGEFDDHPPAGRLVNVFQMTIHNIPHTQYKIGYLPRSTFPSKDCLNFLYDYGRKNNLIFIKIEPNLEKSKNYSLPANHYKLIKSPHPLFPKWTQVIDLTKTEDELFKSLKSKTRYNIKLAQKKGVVVREESDNHGFETFSKLYIETCKRQKYFGHNYAYHKTVWDRLKKNLTHILIAYYKDRPLVAYELFLFNKILYYPYGGSSQEYKNMMAANLIMWEVIKFGQKKGALKFDMWGSLPPNYNDKHSWSGFTRFKEGYGGEFVEFVGSYDLIVSPVLYKLYNNLWKLRNFYLKIIS